MSSVNHLNRRCLCVSIKIGIIAKHSLKSIIESRIFVTNPTNGKRETSMHIVRKRPIQICSSSTINVERRTTTAQSITHREISRNFESPNIHRDE
ncbi:hypothetical protein CDAR_437671 [Caerostris darwini]|uniref:Uncharacterized protein n=1 Tax=Caerostris darwini TaxID=1538125 RepID=A0AAV4NSY0_9ARAC|nr:hypothetical protein CDAR_437671 [Caerostris darwini]